MSKSKSLISTLDDLYPLATSGSLPVDGYVDSGTYNLEFHRLFNYYTNLALDRYRWSNLPDDLTSTIIEKGLFFKGQMCFYKSPEFGLVCLQASRNGQNLYGETNEVITHSYTGKVDTVKISEKLDKTEGVLIKANDMACPEVIHLLHYIKIEKLIEELLYMNLNQQKFPVIFNTTNNTRLSVKNFAKKVFDDFFPVQFVDEKLEKALGGELRTEVMNTNIPYIIDKLQEYKHQLQNELREFLGLNSNEQFNKSERLIVDEVNSNNEVIMLNEDLGFKTREEACKKINEKFGLNIKVEKVTDILAPEIEEEEEVKEDDGK